MKEKVKKIKEKIKNNFPGIYKYGREIYQEVYQAYKVSYNYGYIHSNREVYRLLSKLNAKRLKGKGYDYVADETDRFIFIGDKNLTSTMRVAVFGDIDQKETRKNCEFYTTRILKNAKYKKIHDAYFKLNHIMPLPMKSVWEAFYTTEQIQRLGGRISLSFFLQELILKKPSHSQSFWKR